MRILHALVLVVLAAMLSGQAAQPPATRPSWTDDATWYYIVVPRFCNGDPTNDPDETIPWSTDWPTADEASTTDWSQAAATYTQRRYGGDLRGVIQRLPYLKQLGINAICLSPVFHGTIEGRSRHIDLRHVDPMVAVKGSYAETNDEGSEPSAWKWSSSDKQLLEVIDHAHKEGFRVVLGGLFGFVGGPSTPTGEMGPYVMAVARRWMDPNGDGDPSDGVDGWVHSLEETALGVPVAAEKAYRRQLYEAVKAANPNAVLIATGSFAASQVSDGLYDLAMDTKVSAAVQRFFHPNSSSPLNRTFLADMERSLGESAKPDRAAMLTMMSSSFRLLTRFSQAPPKPSVREPLAPGPSPSEQAADHWRLATVFQHLAGGAPVTLYGDEVGMYGGPSAYARAPMWWTDEGGPAKPPGYREDFRLLVEWLHRTSRKYPALQDGAFRAVMQDDARKLLVFARTLPDREAIVLMNYGDDRQEVRIKAGEPGELVAVISPRVKPSQEGDKRKRPGGANRLPVGGHRQYVEADGHVTLWVAPKSARIVLVN